MGGILGNLAYVCSEIWKQLGVAQRISIILVGLLGLTALGAVLFLGTRPNWHIAYSNLPQETAAKVYELAKDAKIPVKLADGGHTVKVPYKYVDQLRVQTSQNHLDVTQKGVGLELFDDLKLGMTEMQQRVGWQRAMQGELERMIGRMEGVRASRVMLALPERRVFRRDKDEKAEASVFLELDRNRSLSRAQVQSICRLVAGSVPTLRPEDVTVTDNEGNLLARGMDDGLGTAGLSQHLELQQHMEDYLREKAEAALRPIVGAGSVVAVVSVELDDSAVETTTETYDSDKAVVIRERVISEDNAKTDHKRTGAAGTATNIVSVQNPQQPATPVDESSESRKTVENEYAVPKTVRRVSGRSPHIQRLSVSVTIAAGADGNPRDAEVLKQYKDLVMAAVGAVTDGPDGRTDSVTVAEGAFADTKAAEASPELSPVDKALELAGRVPIASFGRPALAVFLLLLLYRKFGGVFRRNQFESVDLSNPRANLGGNELPGGNGDAAALLKEVTSVPASKVQTRAQEDPSEVASTLEAWMTRDNKFE
jgi:flagellar M-ring protein FliF